MGRILAGWRRARPLVALQSARSFLSIHCSISNGRGLQSPLGHAARFAAKFDRSEPLPEPPPPPDIEYGIGRG